MARARADFEALSQIARVFSSPLDDTPAMVEAQREKLQEADRTRRRLATELAQASGRALYAETAAGPDGIRRAVAPRGIAFGGIASRGSELHCLRASDFSGRG